MILWLTTERPERTVIQETLGVTPEFVRPPLLMWNDKVANVCEELGLSIVTGNVSWRDFPAGYNLEESGSATYESLTTHAHDGAIWALHAHSSDTPAAFISTLPVLYEQGYRFCTVAELMEYNGQTRQPGVAYGEVVAVY